MNISGMFEDLEKLNEHRRDSEYGRGTHVDNNLDIIMEHSQDETGPERRGSSEFEINIEVGGENMI